MKKLISILLIFCLLSTASSFSAKQTWAAGSFYFTPAGGSYGKGSTINVNVGVNTGGDLVNAVQANVSYPADKLQFLSVSTGGSALSIFAEKYASGGVVRIAGGVSGQGFSGSRPVASINFKVLTDSGSGSLSFAGGSAALSSSNNQSIASGGGGATYTFTNQSAAKADSKDNQLLQITDVKVENIGKSSATVVWKTDKPSNSKVEYGLNSLYGLVESNADSVGDHTIKLSSALITPGATYHFRVVSQGAVGDESVGDDLVFTTTGFAVQIKVTDKAGKPLSGAKVLLYPGPKEQITRDDGIVVFDNAVLGNQPVVVEYKGKSQIYQTEIKENDKLQTFDLTFAKSTFITKENWLIGLFVFGLFSLLVIGGAKFKKILKIKNSRS